MKRNIPRAALVLFIATLAGCGPKPATVAPPAPAPPVVLVATATGVGTSTFIEAVATLEGASSQEIYSPVSGYVVRQTYLDGAFVRAGDLLFVIDSNPGHTITKVTSPISGVVAHPASAIGDLIDPSMMLTTVSHIDFMEAEFALPAQVFRDHAVWFTGLLKQPMAARPENARLLLEDGTNFAKAGRLSTIDNHPTTPTRIYNSAALFPNPDHQLKPGQFAKVRLTIDADSQAVLVPEPSVTHTADIDQVIVVKPDNTVEIRRVTLGDKSGSSRIVTAGLAAGERVVVVGIERCAPGATVAPQPYVEPAPEPLRQ